MKQDDAAAVFNAGFNCAQAVLVPFAKESGIPEDTCHKTAAAFGGGIGRMQSICGAASGACMIIGLRHGSATPGDQASRTEVLSKTKAFLAAFKHRFGSVDCRDLLGCDLNTDEGQRIHKDDNQRELICMNCVKFAADYLETR